MKYCKGLCFFMLISFTLTVNATTVIQMYDTTNPTQFSGTITATQTAYGLLLTPHLAQLPSGRHGFHLHQTANCGNNGLDAGGHFDPKHTGKHLGPFNNNGHLGDLPALWVDGSGQAILPVLAPRLSESELVGHALIIHAGGDNYQDSPHALGGGGKRIACGIIMAK